MDPSYFEKTYYAQPDKARQKAFDLLGEAMPRNKGWWPARCWEQAAYPAVRMDARTAVFEDEIVTAPAKTESKLTKAEVTMAKQLIDQLSGSV